MEAEKKPKPNRGGSIVKLNIVEAPCFFASSKTPSGIYRDKYVL